MIELIEGLERDRIPGGREEKRKAETSGKNISIKFWSNGNKY
jgi:hypothetical protein